MITFERAVAAFGKPLDNAARIEQKVRERMIELCSQHVNVVDTKIVRIVGNEVTVQCTLAPNLPPEYVQVEIKLG